MAKTRATLVKKLDRIFSQFIRLRATDAGGVGKCYTCNSRRHYTEVDAGHFMSRACMSTRWDEQNVQFQCKRCNGFRSGEQYEYALQLDMQYGDGTASMLHSKSKQMKKWTISELEHMIEHYKRRVNELRSDRGMA